jgi:murein DD-endopeptidase MepM/ murein hydrolase activator NlpD
MSPLRPLILLMSCLISCLASCLAIGLPTAAFAVGAATEPRGEWPLRPRPEVVRVFDAPAVVWSSGHRGVDLEGSVGQRVRAALPGRVSFVGRIAGVGVVSVDHGATRTTYQPVSPAVTLGRDVAAGAVLGTLEWFGTHCLPHACLHWGLIEGDRYLDPLSLVGGPRPVRLLPLDGGYPATPLSLPPTLRVAVPLPTVPLPPLTPWG